MSKDFVIRSFSTQGPLQETDTIFMIGSEFLRYNACIEEWRGQFLHKMVPRLIYRCRSIIFQANIENNTRKQLNTSTQRRFECDSNESHTTINLINITNERECYTCSKLPCYVFSLIMLSDKHFLTVFFCDSRQTSAI